MLKNADLQRLLESDGDGGDGDAEATIEVPGVRFKSTTEGLYIRYEDLT